MEALCVSPLSGWASCTCLASSCSIAGYFPSRRNGFDKPAVKTKTPGQTAPAFSIHVFSSSLQKTETYLKMS